MGGIMRMSPGASVAVMSSVDSSFRLTIDGSTERQHSMRKSGPIQSFRKWSNGKQSDDAQVRSQSSKLGETKLRRTLKLDGYFGGLQQQLFPWSSKIEWRRTE
jgi:hypothetical protein